MYIVFEWIVWTGKSTQAQLLRDHIKRKHPDKNILLTREPGGTEIAEAIRVLVQWTDFEEEMHPITEAYLYAAARAQLITKQIKPFLDKGGIVISDRNVISSVVIQGETKGIGIETVMSINMIAIQNCLPDVIFHLSLPIETALSRTSDHDGDKHERQWRAFYEKQYKAYHSLERHPLFAPVWKHVDASGSVDEIQQRILDIWKEIGEL